MNEEEHQRDLEFYIALERQAKERVERLVDLLAAGAGPVWNWGDGQGGWVRDELGEAFDRHGLYRAPRQASTGRKPIPAGVRTAVYERDAYRCRECGDHRALQVDHIVPLVDGGGDEPENLQTLCGPCNRAKGPRRGRGKRGA